MTSMSGQGFYLVFGITADPPHLGHEQVIINSYQYMTSQQLTVTQFDLMPTYQANLIGDKKKPVADFNQRLKMCQITAADLNDRHGFNVQVNDLERTLSQQVKGKNYSIDTLSAIQHPHKMFVLSADHFAGRWPKFRKWHRYEDLVFQNGLLIHQRPGHPINNNFIKQLKSINPHVYVVSGLKDVSASSTQIRNNCSQHLDLLNKKIHFYLAAQQLYGLN